MTRRGRRRSAAAVVGGFVAAIAFVASVVAGHSLPAAAGAAGTITTFAGGGAPGDGGPPTQANFAPTSAAIDQAGNLCVADTQNQRIRKISAGADCVVGSVGRGGLHAQAPGALQDRAGSSTQLRRALVGGSGGRPRLIAPSVLSAK